MGANTKRGFPSSYNAQGHGYRKSIKPELLLPGGRVSLEKPLQLGATELRVARARKTPGQLVASPGRSADTSATVSSRGTSNATALLSRASGFLFEVIADLRRGDDAQSLEKVPDAVLLKTLLVHGARWETLGEHLRSLLQTPERARKMSEYLTRLLGYGPTDVESVQECTANRVTAVAGGVLGDGRASIHRFPLPPSLSGVLGQRRLTATLAWMTPINPSHHKWRRAHLWFGTPAESKLKVGSGKPLERAEADYRAVQRGTVQHEVFTGSKAVAFVDGDDLVVQVNCRADAGSLDIEVPYGLAITLEVDVALGLDIYTEIRDRVRSRVPVRPADGGS